jgi:hypothetical protein
MCDLRLPGDFLTHGGVDGNGLIEHGFGVGGSLGPDDTLVSVKRTHPASRQPLCGLFDLEGAEHPRNG